MPEALSRRVGPLPVWGWVVVAIAAFLVWRRSTERGWFPTASIAVSGSGTGGSVRSFLGLAVGPGEPSEEPSGSALFLGGGGSRPTLPVPITESGPDGSVFGGGETFAATSTASTLDPRFTEVGKSGELVQVMPIGSASTRPGGITGVLGRRRTITRRTR